MEIERWNPSHEYTNQEQRLMKRLGRHKKLYAFLRAHRHELLDEAFQAELAEMYRDTGAGKEPVNPAVMAMAVVLQEYAGVSDAEAVECTVVDLRWQLVLGRLGASEPAFSQATFWEFRQRLIRYDMDRRLLERTRELARHTKEFDWKKLPKRLELAVDSSPLSGAGRVEDTFNLLGHAARKIVTCAAELLERTFEETAQEAGIPLLLAPSIKAGLDIEWEDEEAVVAALNVLVDQIEALQAWLATRPLEAPELAPQVATLVQIQQQDLAPAAAGGGRVQLRTGVARDRRISIEDEEMRHGRKSRSRRFNGYKRHIALDLCTGLITACALTPANQPEQEAMASIQADLAIQGLTVGTLHIDRGYIASPEVSQVLADQGDVLCRPWRAGNDNGLFRKQDFALDLEAQTITCPAGQTRPIQLGHTVPFPATVCDPCPMRARCTKARPGHGRTIRIAKDEALQQELRLRMRTPEGRAALRKRTAVEHALAHIGQRQGNRARYRGMRKNLFDLRRAAAIQNLETIQRKRPPIKVQIAA